MGITKAIRNITQSELGVILPHLPCEMSVVTSNQVVWASIVTENHAIRVMHNSIE